MFRFQDRMSSWERHQIRQLQEFVERIEQTYPGGFTGYQEDMRRMAEFDQSVPNGIRQVQDAAQQFVETQQVLGGRSLSESRMNSQIADEMTQDDLVPAADLLQDVQRLVNTPIPGGGMPDEILKSWELSESTRNLAQSLSHFDFSHLPPDLLGRSGHDMNRIQGLARNWDGLLEALNPALDAVVERELLTPQFADHLIASLRGEARQAPDALQEEAEEFTAAISESIEQIVREAQRRQWPFVLIGILLGLLSLAITLYQVWSAPAVERRNVDEEKKSRLHSSREADRIKKHSEKNFRKLAEQITELRSLIEAPRFLELQKSVEVRDTPSAAEASATVPPGSLVEIDRELDGWIKIVFVQEAQERSGWLPKEVFPEAVKNDQ